MVKRNDISTTTRPVRVVHLITNLDRGGAESILRDVVTCSDRQQFEHVVVSLFLGDTPIADDIRSQGIRVIDMGMSSKWDAGALIRLGATIRRESPDIVQGWLFHTNVLARVVGRMCRVPIVVSAHHSVSTEGRHRDFLYKWTHHMDDRAIAVCDAVRRAEIERTGVAEDRIVTIYNGIPDVPPADRDATRQELLDLLQLPGDARLVGTIGRLSQAKGYPDYARAIQVIVKAHPDAHFVWVGGGSDRSALTAAVVRLGIAEHVHMLGDRSDARHLLAAMDIFVLPSLWEGLSIALLEAMAAGLPVVATAVGGTPEVVVAGETGVLVPPSNPDELANAVIKLLNDPAAARKMGQAGRDRVAERFTVNDMVGAIESLYASLLGAANIPKTP